MVHRRTRNFLIRSQFGPGVVALTVLMSSQVFQVIPHIHELFRSMLGHTLTGCQVNKLICGRMVFRHEVILLIVRKRSGYFPQ